MGWKPLATLTVAFLTLPVALNAEPAGAELIVRTYNNQGVSVADLAAARRHVEAIFHDAGIQVSWKDCWYRDREAADGPQCRQPAATDEVTLRLQAANARPGTRFLAMGFSLVNLADGIPFLATVFTDLVTSTARTSNAEFSLLLGRAIAHELGHLLLDANSHPDEGLMRADWTRSELRRNQPADWVFRPAEMTAIRMAAASRNSR